MGRPEKSESRDLSPAVHTLFPITELGGSQRSVGEAARNRTDKGKGVYDVLVGERECPECGEHSFKPECTECSTHTEPYYECDECGLLLDDEADAEAHEDNCDAEEPPYLQ